MKKIGKIFAIVLGVLVLAFIAIVIALPFLIDPNDYKNQIAQAVKQHTGRELTIGGKIGLSFFPWLGVEMRQLALSNAPGFGDQPFARIDTAGVKVKLLPLLKKDVVVDKVLLTGLNLNLAKNRSGKTNWDDLTAANSPQTPSAAPAPKESAPAINALSIGGIDVSAGEISWKDETSGASYKLHNVELKSGELASGKPVDLKLGLDLESAAPAFRTHVDLKTRIAVDVDKQNLAVSDLTFDAAGVKLKANATGTHILSAPAFSGNLELASFSPRAVLEKLGIKIETADKTALNKAALSTKFDASAKHLRLQNLGAGLDDSKLTGSLEIVNFAAPSYRVDLALDTFDLDRYLPPAAAAPPKKAPPPNAAKTAGAAPLPLDALAKLDAEGQFRIGKLKTFGVRASDVLIRLHAKNGQVRIDPSEAKLYGGSHQGTISYDVRARPAALSINEQLTGVQFEPLFKDADLPIPFSGTGNLTGKIAAQGTNVEALKASLSGQTEFIVKDGALRGIDLGKVVEQARVLREKQSFENLANVVPQKTDQTKFSQLRASVQIKNGIAQNNDMIAQIPNITKVTGKGTANLVSEMLDYRILLDDFPIRIYGPFSALKYDLSEAGKALLQRQLERRLGLDKPGTNQAPGEKQKPEDLLKDLIRKRLNK